MPDVLVFERAPESFAAALARRGHHIVYRVNETNHCPGCGRSQWLIGRSSAECGFCGSAVPLARTSGGKAANSSPRPDSRPPAADQRRHPRMRFRSRELKILVDGSPSSFALHNISEGGVMGELAGDLRLGALVHVRFEGGILIPATVKWTDKGLVGLAFVEPILLDGSAEHRN